jgi:hypothetical protein
VESIELVDMYLVPSLVLLVPTQERIGIDFPGFKQYFGVFSMNGGRGRQVCEEKLGVKSIELVEIYLVPSLVLLVLV